MKLNAIEKEMILHAIGVMCELLEEDGDEEIEEWEKLKNKIEKNA